MLKNYLRTALRNLRKARAYTAINLTGLSIGMAVTLLIGLWIWDELSYNKNMPQYDRIAQVWQSNTTNGEKAVTMAAPFPLSKELRAHYGGNFRYVVMSTWFGDHMVTRDRTSLTTNGAYMEADAPDMLSLKMISGTRAGIKEGQTVLLSKSTATAIFGNEDPMGKLFRIDDKVGVEVTGVYEDLPKNCDFSSLGFIASWQAYLYSEPAIQTTMDSPWDISAWLTYVEIAPNTDMASVTAHIRKVRYDNCKPEGRKFDPQLFLHPMSRWYLYSEFKNGVNTGGRIQYVWLFGIIGIFVLLLACINFMNLSTARSEHRAKEVGIRKAIGSMRSQLVVQFFTESVYRAGRHAALPRQVLVVLQFTVSICLIIGTIVVFRQVQYARGRPIGYDQSGLISLNMATDEIARHFDAVSHELRNTDVIEDMAGSSGPVTGVWSTSAGFDWTGKDPNLAVEFPTTGVSPQYGHTVGWNFVAGRDFSTDMQTDSLALVINETAARFIGMKDPVGKFLVWNHIPFRIIGVIKDMLMESPYAPVRPSLYCLVKNHDAFQIVRLNRSLPAEKALAQVQAVFKKYAPSQPFNYEFVDLAYAQKFGNEQRTGKLAGIFALLAIFISCLGLFGMAAYVAEQRTKEIGIRKVLEAGVFGLWQLMSKDFVLLIAIALLIAMPLSWYAMNRWLQGYEYRSGIAWWIFAATAAAALVITALTVSVQALRTATANPIKALRSE